MTRRSLLNSRQLIDRAIEAARHERTRRAYLVNQYRDKTSVVLIQFTDPRLSVRGTTVRASISPGLWGLISASPNLDAGYPVTVVIRRGQVEVVGF